MARSPSSHIILPCPAKRVSAFSVVDGSVYRPPYQVRPFARPGALSAQMDLTLFVYTPPNGGAIAAAFRLLPFAAGKRFGDIEVIGADALIGIEDVELDQHADRRRGVVRANAHELALATGTDQLMESSRFGL